MTEKGETAKLPQVPIDKEMSAKKNFFLHEKLFRTIFTSLTKKKFL